MLKALTLLRLCARDLQVLKFDGNFFSDGCLRALADELTQTGQRIEVLSMIDCGIVVTSTQTSSLYLLLDIVASSLVSNLLMIAIGLPRLVKEQH